MKLAATFKADGAGTVDVNSMAPLSGSYSGVDGMGLFWSMKRMAKNTAKVEKNVPAGIQSMPVNLTLEADGQVLAQQAVERMFYDETRVERREISEDGMVAALFVPKGDGAQAGPRPGIIWLGGSEGGLTEGYPALLASHGYVTLALAYFKAGSLPAELVEIPLESLKKGIDWFRAQPEVDPQRVALIGGSKGAELALLLAATYPEAVHGVVAYKPSSVVWLGIPKNQSDILKGPKSSWTLNGQPLPFVRGSFSMDLIKVMAGQQAAMVGSYEGGLKDQKAVEAAAIPVEKIQGPVLLLSGADDQLWPSTQMSNDVIKRLDRAGFPYIHDHVAYEDTGHGLALPNTPTADINRDILLLGGNTESYGRRER